MLPRPIQVAPVGAKSKIFGPATDCYLKQQARQAAKNDTGYHVAYVRKLLKRLFGHVLVLGKQSTTSPVQWLS